MLSRYRRLRQNYPRACRHGIMAVLKLETGFMKMGATKITPYWREFCYWETSFGYTPPKDIEVLWPEVKSWLCTDLKLGGPMGEGAYLKALYEETKAFMKSEWELPARLPSVEEWIREGKWMEGKAGTGQKIEIHIGGKRKRVGSKPVEGVVMSDEAVRNELFTPVREVMKVIQKSETSKIRGVVKTGNAVNRKMNYLSEYLEVGLHGSKLSTLFAGERGNEAIDMDLLTAVRQKDLIKVPLDQGGFDQHQSKKSIAAVMLAVGEYISNLTRGTDFEGVWAALWDSLFVKGAQVECGDYRGEWNNGLPSEWRWTAVLDTILNVCSFRVIARISMDRIGKKVYIGNFYAQGDDVIFSTNSELFVKTAIDTYQKIGYEVHQMKTYISTWRGEFLRRSYEPTGVTGYVARSMVNIRFKNPILASPIDKHEQFKCMR